MALPFPARVHALCEAHLADPTFGAERLAATLGLTARHVRRLMVAETGEGPRDLLRRLRMERAARLLAAPGVTAREAARAVGYRDVSAFRRAYRAVAGRSSTPPS
ncbi:helix-turn-helix transcriptional regulator [Rubrivirga sp. IMCC43871]|uniref:helix-turn-helix transcriptional regulator n=1 Tax=Rubrivirga sp. IMCC43871 TaxID=3391575 RepID=UPI00398FBC4E